LFDSSSGLVLRLLGLICALVLDVIWLGVRRDWEANLADDFVQHFFALGLSGGFVKLKEDCAEFELRV